MFKTDNHKEDYDYSLLQFVRPTMMSFIIVVVTKKWSADALVRARENLALWSAAAAAEVCRIWRWGNKRRNVLETLEEGNEEIKKM